MSFVDAPLYLQAGINGDGFLHLADKDLKAHGLEARHFRVSKRLVVHFSARFHHVVVVFSSLTFRAR